MDVKYLIKKMIQKIFSQPIVRSSSISKKAAVWNNCLIINCQIDDFSYVSSYTNMYYVKMGKFCSVGPYCCVGGASHPIDFVSTSPVFLNGRNALNTHFANIPYEPYKEIVIGNDVWIGAKCCIKSGITIGDGAVIGMGSVVTKDVGPYEIWGGNPAKLIRKRFDEDVVNGLLDCKFYQLTDKELLNIGDKIRNPREFLGICRKNRG